MTSSFGLVAKTQAHSTTVKLDDPLLERIARAMRVEGQTVYSDFARMALMERCRRIEADLRRTNFREFEFNYPEEAVYWRQLRDDDSEPEKAPTGSP